MYWLKNHCLGCELNVKKTVTILNGQVIRAPLVESIYLKRFTSNNIELQEVLVTTETMKKYLMFCELYRAILIGECGSNDRRPRSRMTSSSGETAGGCDSIL